MKRKQEESHENEERWLLTYSDLITLLMAFFTIMFAMASVDAKKFKSLSQSMNIAFESFGSGGGGTNIIADFEGGGIAPVPKSEDEVFAGMKQEIQKYASTQGLSGSVRITIAERGMVVNLADTILFESGKVDLSPKSLLILDKLGEILFKTGNMIRVEGHSDNVPIHSGRYRSNWQLSTDRATGVIMYWISKNPEVGPRLSAAGYGEYRPVAPNTTPEGRNQNRRVDIVVLREASAKEEPKATKSDNKEM